MFCANCGNQLNPGARFCGKCGAEQPLSCVQCGSGINPGARFCGKCGAVQPGPGSDPYFGTAAPQQSADPLYRRTSAYTGSRNSGFAEAVKMFFLRWNDCHGRSSRMEFCYVILFRFLVSVPFTLIGKAAESLLPSLIVSLVLLVPSFSLTMRRVHDVSRDGTPVVIFYAGMLVEYLICLISLLSLSGLDPGSSYTELFVGLAASLGGLILMMALGLVLMGLGIYLLTVVFKEGHPRTNRYGSAPQ